MIDFNSNYPPMSAHDEALAPWNQKEDTSDIDIEEDDENKLIVAYRRTCNDLNGNPRYIIHIGEIIGNNVLTKYDAAGLKWRHNETGYLITSYSIEYDIKRKFPDAIIWKM